LRSASSVETRSELALRPSSSWTFASAWFRRAAVTRVQTKMPMKPKATTAAGAKVLNLSLEVSAFRLLDEGGAAAPDAEEEK